MLNYLFQPVKYIADQLPLASFCEYDKRSLDGVEYIVVHQTDDLCEENTPQDIAEHHITGRGFCGIGYHYYIDDKGKVSQVNDLETWSFHASYYNENGVGVVICGEHRLDECVEGNEKLVGKRQYNALIGTILKIQRKLPKGKEIAVIGHTETEGTDKSCPNLDMDELRADVEKARNNRIATLGVVSLAFLVLVIGLIFKVVKR